MAKELVAVLVTDNNGEALYNYTGTGAGQTTFVAESGDLISNSLTVNDINTTLTVTADKSILSHTDNESCTITATYEGETIEGQTIVFKNGSTVLATKTTNSNGVATYEYESQGIGDITITVECMNLQETYELIDAKYYASNSRIESKGVDFNNQRKIFFSDYQVAYDDKVYFKLGDTVPTNMGVGVGGKDYNNDIFIEKTGSTTKLYRTILSNESITNPFVANHKFGMLIIDDSPNDKCYLYDNDTPASWWQIQLSKKLIRVDKYYSYPYTIEIIVL